MTDMKQGDALSLPKGWEIKKDFDAVNMMRKIRDKIDRETAGMTFEQLKEYYEKKAKKSELKTD